MKRLFPEPSSDNRIIIVGTNPLRPFAALMSDVVAESQVLSNDQCLPLFLYSNPDSSEDLFSDQEGEKSYAISDRTLASYVKRYGKTVNKEMIFYYIYGLLNCPDYINNFSTELRKGLPRIPQVNNFFELAEIGLALGDLHVNYETLK